MKQFLSKPCLSLQGWFRTARTRAALLLILLAGARAVPDLYAAAAAPDAFVQNQGLGRGVNILGYDPIWRSREQARFAVKHFRLLQEAGFDSVRINLHPFRHTKREQNWKLPEDWLATTDWSVTNALAGNLKVIIDLHEFNAMGEDPEGRHEQFLATWRQLATHFKSAPDGVLFEILNEPSNELTPELWNRYLGEALAVIRESNPVRTVIVGPAFWNSIAHLQELELPADDRQLIVTVHYYQPMDFTHQGATWTAHKDKSNVVWFGSAEERKAIRQDFAKAADWARKANRPIFLGEFGAYDKAPMESRTRYTDAIARTAEAFGWSWAYWQLDSDFVLYDMKADAWVQPIRDGLIPPGENDVRAGRYPGKPFQNRVQRLPGRLECELYDEGGESVAYHETDGRNHGNGELNKGGSERDNFRKDENVDISYTKNDWDNSEFNRVPQELGRFYVGWTAAGEWIRYTVDFAKAGRYSLGVMYTSRYEGNLLLSCDERPAGPPIRLASTADDRDTRRNWHHWNYLEQKDAVLLPAGRHVLTIKILDPGNLNLDRIEFIAAQESERASAPPAAPDSSQAPGPAGQLGWQLAVHSWTFQKFSLFDAIDKTAALGVNHMSISGSYNWLADGKLTKLPTASLIDADFAAIQAHMKTRGLNPTFLNMGVVKPGADEAASRKIFEAAKRFGIEVLVAEPEKHGRMEELPKVMDVVEKLAKEYHIKVAIHNHPGPENFYWNPVTVLAAVKGRSSLLGGCADTGHYVRSGLDPVECLKKLEGRLIALHFKDLN